MSTSNPDGPQTSARRSRSAAQIDESPDAGPSDLLQTESAKKKQKTFALRPWLDIPQWTSDKPPLMEMPLEIWDKIIWLWPELANGSDRPTQKVSGWNSPRLCNQFGTFEAIMLSITSFLLPASRPIHPLTRVHIRSQEKRLLVTSTCFYRLETDDKQMTLPFQLRRNPHNPHGRNAAPMKLFNSARVRALALGLHGGPLGHEAHLNKLAEKDAKAKETRKKNGTVQIRKSPWIRGFPLGPIVFPEDNFEYDDPYD
ncbi:hypothetical protein PILCRDRAFT_86176 [Piloderma croceum F 1598]|uniref:Uncharacterized protein n=1 Tax=Piloderma croceum (strain F 1598) TaxID=765440 RepID=A0A0C3BKU9_PILCF|nr:hypothetical protein PILCRDRAFT_86176 [Piloderma croceum F 1598]